MLANAQEIESDALTDLPPPNWYTDPTDESQYRYWDGSVWTEYRAPRYAEGAKRGLRGSGELLGDSFSLMRRQWRGNALAVAVLGMSQILVVSLFLLSANDVLMGELGEIWDRVNQPSFDPTTPDEEAYFESLQFDFSLLNFVPAFSGLLISWIAGTVFTAIVSVLAISDLRGPSLRLSEVLRWALKRLPRLIGLDLQILLLGLAALAVVVLPALVAPALLFFLIPLAVAAFFLWMTVVTLAYVVAAVGPAEMSLRYAVRLVRGRFWGVLGRMLLVLLVAMVISLVVGMVFVFATTALGASAWLGQVINSLVSIFFEVLMAIAAVVIYHDLGGESV